MNAIEQIVSLQHEYFTQGHTKNVQFRLEALTTLASRLTQYESRLNDALQLDLNKGPFEAYMSEVGLALDELRFQKKHLRSWVKNKTVTTPLPHFSSRSFTSPQPRGVVLIIAPWNYPVLLTLTPLIGAIAAGNCVVLKPSAYAPHTSACLRELLSVFDEHYVAVVEGGRAENQALLEQKFDFIFFTGSTAVGREVMEKAARHCTPVCLELGGKSPCIVDDTANIPLAAKRIAFGKCLNAGQTCVAPDHVWVQESVKAAFLAEYVKAVKAFFGGDEVAPQGATDQQSLAALPGQSQRSIKAGQSGALQTDDYVRIINRKHFDRLTGLLQGENVYFGGASDAEKLRLEPTVLVDVSVDSPVMQEEIFGPILPVLGFKQLAEVISSVQSQARPLALYLFTTNRAHEKLVLDSCSFGGGCINDTVVHLATPYMPFGGNGESGMGSYHGKQSFETFSHRRSILKKHNWMDLPIRYRKYSSLKFKLLRLFLR